MLNRFRPVDPGFRCGDIGDLVAVAQVIEDAIRPGHFFVAPSVELAWISGQAETIPWEIFRGRALDAAQTRLQQTFISWHVAPAGSGEAILSVKLDVHAREIHVTRGLRAYVWEGYDAGGIIESREVIRWTRELVGTLSLGDFSDLENLHDELLCRIWQAIVGTSRLPLTSVEAPLPDFVFGKVHYAHRAAAREVPVRSWSDFLRGGIQPTNAPSESVKLVEFALRYLEPAGLPELVMILMESCCRDVLPRIFRQMFNDVSLSPQTCFVDNALECWDRLAEEGAFDWETKVEFLSRLLRQLCRHLTAYDLITFHHRGANYPDALLLDEVLKRYLREAETWPDRFLGDDDGSRLLRRALRQACLIRRYYEGHRVPDRPTSPGENARVLPPTHPRLPEDQLLQPLRRRRVLFAGVSLPDLLSANARQILEQSVRDLAYLDERVELGLGIFIDRPLGYAKEIGEPDLTPLLAHEAFSPTLARRRWHEIKGLIQVLAIPFDTTSVDERFEKGEWPAGLPHAALATCPRPTAALTDVRQVADDFIILRTLPVGLGVLLGLLVGVNHADSGYRICVAIGDTDQGRRLALYDAHIRLTREFRIDVSLGYFTRAGIELPRAGVATSRDCQGAERQPTPTLPHGRGS